MARKPPPSAVKRRDYLLRRPSRVVSRSPLAARVEQFNPDKAAAWATWMLKNRRVTVYSSEFIDAMETTDGDPITHHAAWIQYLTAQLQNTLKSVPADIKKHIMGLITFAFEIGAHHEAITVEKRLRRDVERSRGSMEGASAGGRSGAASKWQDVRVGKDQAIKLYRWRLEEGDSDREARELVRKEFHYSVRHLSRILPKRIKRT
jgi:hypothetical protein